MKLSDIYGYGQLFGFSGVDGETDAEDDFIALTLQRPIEIRFSETCCNANFGVGVMSNFEN